MGVAQALIKWKGGAISTGYTQPSPDFAKKVLPGLQVLNDGPQLWPWICITWGVLKTTDINFTMSSKNGPKMLLI